MTSISNARVTKECLLCDLAIEEGQLQTVVLGVSANRPQRKRTIKKLYRHIRPVPPQKRWMTVEGS